GHAIDRLRARALPPPAARAADPAPGDEAGNAGIDAIRAVCLEGLSYADLAARERRRPDATRAAFREALMRFHEGASR
ncbi:MAG: hypothetical protein ACK5L9_04440, partial [Paracoccus sp. (in: a-proteobacteria)]